MNQMIKHVGKHADKRVAVIFRTVPGEDHMALVTYPDSLKQQTHDDLMNAIQSVKGQEANHLGEALHSMIGADGQTLLNSLHREGFMKKVRTQDIIMMPRPNTPGVRLDEINKIINDLDTGSKAAQDMAKLDAQAGLADPDKNAAAVQAAAAVVGTPGEKGILSDSILAEQLMEQANQMKSQMESLANEVTRLTEEAAALNPELAVKKKRGRPAKATA